MEEAKNDRAATGRGAQAVDFICGPDHPTTVALKASAESGSEQDIKKARTLFLSLKPGDRRAAWTPPSRTEMSSWSSSASSVLRFLLPLGRPLGLPDWPALNRLWPGGFL